MVIGILLAGVVTGLAVDAFVPAWVEAKALAKEGDEEDFGTPDPMHEEWDRLENLANRGDWGGLFRAIPGFMVRGWREAGPTSLAVLTGVCWLLFLLQAIQIRSRGDYRGWGILGGLTLGVLSIWPTIFLIYWQQVRWGIEESDQLANGLHFFILGVGLREEFSKFICFLPLLPLAVRGRDELSALLMAGAVGLGFAMEENVSYIGGSLGGATLVRLMMPAPFHVATTGLLGLAAYRACVWPKQCGPQFIAMFGVIVLTHGLYDAFISLPALKDLSIATWIIFVLLMYQFFRELRSLQRPKPNSPISLTANFLFCVSTVAAATFVYLCAAVGWKAAGDVLVGGIVAQSVMVYLFLREMPETMVTV
jgi:RsiW-degrading membrane proteinase PrsW (M82 family)